MPENVRIQRARDQAGDYPPTGSLRVDLRLGDCVQRMEEMGVDSFDAVVTDPSYGLEFMGKEWDSFPLRLPTESDKRVRTTGNGNATSAPGFARGVRPFKGGQIAQAWHQRWATAILRILKPGGYMLAFGGTRTYHRLTCAVEDAGFHIVDTIMWLWGSGFPKGKGQLKPSWNPILLCRRPGPKVLPLGIEECRVRTTEADIEEMQGRSERRAPNSVLGRLGNDEAWEPTTAGRWPANVVIDDSEEVLKAFAEFEERKGDSLNRQPRQQQEQSGQNGKTLNSGWQAEGWETIGYGGTGTAARFFYCAKASRRERGEGNAHPTVKPLALMEWLVKLVCPPEGLCLDLFLGSGTTALACIRTGRRIVGIEKDADYLEIARKRCAGSLARYDCGTPARRTLFDE